MTALIKRYGVYFTSAIINGVQMDCVIDTGSTDCCLTKEFVFQLVKSKNIKWNDFVAPKKFQTAGGISTEEGLVLRSVTIGNVTVKDVSASVSHVTEFCLIGMSFLDKLKSWTIYPSALRIEFSG